MRLLSVLALVLYRVRMRLKAGIRAARRQGNLVLYEFEFDEIMLHQCTASAHSSRREKNSCNTIVFLSRL